MKKLLTVLFGTRRQNNQVAQIAEIVIEHDMPLTVKGVPYTDVLKMKRYLEHLKKGDSFPLEPRLAYTVRKLSKHHFPEYNISVRNTGTFYRAYRLA